MARNPNRSSSNRTTSRSPARPRRAPRRGLGWLVLLVVFGGVLALVIWKPEVVSGLFADPARPVDEGDPPTTTADVDAEAGFKDIPIESKGFAGAEKGLSEAVADRQPEPEVKQPPQRVQESQTEIQGRSLLAEATAAYHGMDWDGTQRIIRRIADLEVSDGIRAKADELGRYSDGLRGLFERLGSDKEELMRNIITHPSLIFLQYQGNFAYYVPLQSMDGETIIGGDNPAVAFKTVLQRDGRAPVMDARRIKVMLEAGNVGSVENANVEELKADRLKRFEENLAKLEASEELRADPMAWYAAARYAYQNRLPDRRVVELLEEAFIRDTDLATTIREDKASDLYAAMVLHLNSGNKQAAGAFMAKLSKQYRDTAIHAQARAHYDGELEQLAAVRKQATAERKQRRQEARERRLAQAKEKNDEEEIAEIKQEQAVEERFEERMVAATGDASEADQLFAQGEEIYQRAVHMEASNARDGLYAKAQPYFEKAMAIYSKLGMEGKMATANQLRYACIKMRRPF